MSFQQIATSVTILQSGLVGYQAISLTNFETSAESAIAAGSSVEIAGAFFQAVADITPNASSLTAIVSGTTCYLALTPSGSAGSQILSAAWQSDFPVWSDSKQGWYASAASNVRIVAGMRKIAAGNYTNKILMPKYEINYSRGRQVFLSSGTFLVPIGVKNVFITGCAAGGNGGNASSASGGTRGGRGGAGEIAIDVPFSVSGASAITVVIGSVAVNSSFGTFVLNAGTNGSTGVNGTNGALNMGTYSGGLVPDGTTTVTSSPGAGGILGGGGGGGGSSFDNGTGGAGGAGHFVRLQPATAGSGSNGGNGGFGSGGGGGGANSGTGGAGGPAILIVEW
jgi:hypothetical protein